VFHCTPHPGLATVVYRHAAVNLATCKQAPDLVVSSPGSKVRGNSIVVNGKVVVAVPRSEGRAVLAGASGDRKWVLYAIDPMGSASIAADGLQFRAASVATHRTYPVSFGLNYASYRTWCDFRTLVMTGGGDRIANHGKHLIVTGPPSWKPRPLVSAPKRAFGSVVCAPDGNSVVVQEEPAGRTSESSTASHWQLWRIALGGAATRLTNPHAGYSDDSPQFSADQSALYFVRSRNDHGSLYALRDGKVIGPLLDLGRVANDYGHRDWPYRVVTP
jgi:hypothetical protein